MATASRRHSDNRTVFLDDGGVMNDNELRGPQWQRLLGEFIPSRLGGKPREWSAANSIIFEELFNEYEPRWGKEPLSGFYDDYLFDWLSLMCERVGVSVPGRDEALYIAQEATGYVTRRVHAAFPGAVEAIRQLHARGYVLHTASAEHSNELAGYLEAMGVRELFGKLYGPDLLNLPVQGPQYYEHLFQDSGTAAAEAVVVDDSPDRAAWAMYAGASAVLVSRDGPAPNVGCPVISSLAELPSLMGKMVAP